ncbi:MAG: TIGR04282 family arsenosugar biosynthesis glycosyltransferase [Candidatus Solibacter usitatus]|nr:TIGR04282 family arsenosugar biosynthesis glycosyltransferase [Candidatus Solibacter usitatus]
MRPVVIVFAKAPIAGRVKTRLIPRLGAKGAAELHRAFVREMLARLRGDFDVELHTDEETDAWGEFPVPRRLQAAGDLGQRMHAALEAALEEGRPAAMIVGSDAPTLPRAHVEELLESGADVALGPAEDGGYWGIAARRVAADMFAGVAWSAADTLVRTEAGCARAGLTVRHGRTWYDVDDRASLDRLMGELRGD